MTSKRLTKQVQTAERRTQRVRQLMLDLDRARKADSQKKRKSETHELCVAGGQVKSTALWSLPPATRLGALHLAADRMSELGYLSECEARGKLEEAASQARRKAKADSQERREEKKEERAEQESVAELPQFSESAATPTQPETSKESLIVRFKGPIKGGLGDRLRALGLGYDRDKQEWRGEAVRSAVETEIAGSGSGKLLNTIEAAPAVKPVVRPKEPKNEDEVTVEYCEEIKWSEPDRVEESRRGDSRRKSRPISK
jgi:hypothetical protein